MEFLKLELKLQYTNKVIRMVMFDDHQFQNFILIDTL